jgi:c-di-AMP phosphodiesterase-like protein
MACIQKNENDLESLLSEKQQPSLRKSHLPLPERQVSYCESYFTVSQEDWQDKLELFPIGVVIIQHITRLKYMNRFMKEFFNKCEEEQKIRNVGSYFMAEIDFKIIKAEPARSRLMGIR